MATPHFQTERELVALANMTDADIRAEYRNMERRAAALQAKLGFVPDLDDWEEFE